jgi:glycosyltransferase involved in cell wall biosynthesis
MHLGTPILTSDLDFAREVCGEAAVYFSPWDPDAMATAIERLRDEPGRPPN